MGALYFFLSLYFNVDKQYIMRQLKITKKKRPTIPTSKLSTNVSGKKAPAKQEVRYSKTMPVNASKKDDAALAKAKAKQASGEYTPELAALQAKAATRKKKVVEANARRKGAGKKPLGTKS